MNFIYQIKAAILFLGSIAFGLFIFLSGQSRERLKQQEEKLKENEEINKRNIKYDNTSIDAKRSWLRRYRTKKR